MIRGVLTDLCSIGHLPVPAFPLPSFACWALEVDKAVLQREVVADRVLPRSSHQPSQVSGGEGGTDAPSRALCLEVRPPLLDGLMNLINISIPSSSRYQGMPTYLGESHDLPRRSSEDQPDLTDIRHLRLVCCPISHLPTIRIVVTISIFVVRVSSHRSYPRYEASTLLPTEPSSFASRHSTSPLRLVVRFCTAEAN